VGYAPGDTLGSGGGCGLRGGGGGWGGGGGGVLHGVVIVIVDAYSKYFKYVYK